VAYKGRFSPELAFELMASQGVTHTFLFPTALKAMMKAYPHPRQHFKLQLKAIMSAGEAVGDAVFAYTRDELGVIVNEMFGQTEINYVVGNCSLFWDAKPGSMGKAYPGHRVAVIDDSGRECAVGVPGDVREQIRDPQAGLAVLAEFPRALEDGADVLELGLLQLADRLARVFAVVTGEARLGVEAVDLGDPAFHEQEDDVPGSRTEMGGPGCERIGGGAEGAGGGLEEGTEGEGSKAVGGAGEQGAARDLKRVHGRKMNSLALNSAWQKSDHTSTSLPVPWSLRRSVRDSRQDSTSSVAGMRAKADSNRRSIRPSSEVPAVDWRRRVAHSRAC
jgi:hypothetical protein